MAYLGSCIPGFPNLYIVLGMFEKYHTQKARTQLFLGPNVASGHASIIFSEEAQVSRTAA